MTWAVVQFHDMKTPPIGIWWEPDDGTIDGAPKSDAFPDRYYPVEGSRDEVLAASAMHAKVDGVTWADYFKQLASRPLWGPVYEVTQLQNDTPQAHLDRLIRQAKRA